MSEVCHNLLLVEDRPPDLRIAREYLSQARGAKFNVTTASTLAEALDHVVEGKLDIVMLDLTLPDSSGLETFESLHHASQDLPIVVVSGYAEESLAIAAVRQGAQDYLLKESLSSTLLSRSLLYAIERNQLKLKLKANEERLRQVTENMGEVFWLHEVASWKLLYVSPSYETVWGRSRDELVQGNLAWTETVHPKDRERVVQALATKMIQRPTSEEYRIQLPDGSIRWIRDRGVPILNGSDEVYRVARIAEDVTQQRVLQREVIEATTLEQQRISHDLHDSVGQELTGLSYMARSLVDRLSKQSPAEAALANEILDVTRNALIEVRRAISGLLPVELDADGLMEALRKFTASVQDRVNIPCHFYCETPTPVDDIEVAVHLFRIVQESVNNAIKHGNPTEILVRLEENDRVLRLQVTDNGKGIDGFVEQSEGMGFRIMRYRANTIGATFDVESAIGVGTTVTCAYQRESQNGSD